MAEEQEGQQTGTENIEVTVQDVGPCKKKVTIQIPEERVRKACDEQYESLRRDAFVPGFRKGRAPRRLLEKRYGKEASEQVKLKLLAEATESAIKDNELDVLGEPDLDYENIELPESGPLEFGFEVEVRPEFELPRLEGIPVKKTKMEVDEEQIDRELEQLRKYAGMWAPKEEGAVEANDQIIADVVIDGEEVNEETLDNVEIYVREQGFVGAIPVSNLDELLSGAKQGETRETTVEVPKTYFREEYRGKKVTIKIKIKEIKYLKPAELDENFLQRHGASDEDELREKVRDYLESQLEQSSRSEMSQQVQDYMLENTDFDLPEEMVASQSGSLLQRQYVNLLRRGLPRQQVEEQMEQLRAGSEEQAKKQLKQFFIIEKVADELGIKVTEEEINGYIAQLAIQRGQRPERMREQMSRDNSLEQLKLQIREEKCINKLLESAEITDVEPEEKKEEKGKKKAKSKSKTKSKDKSKSKKTTKSKKKVKED